MALSRMCKTCKYPPAFAIEELFGVASERTAFTEVVVVCVLVVFVLRGPGFEPWRGQDGEEAMLTGHTTTPVSGACGHSRPPSPGTCHATRMQPRMLRSLVYFRVAFPSMLVCVKGGGVCGCSFSAPRVCTLTSCFLLLPTPLTGCLLTLTCTAAWSTWGTWDTPSSLSRTPRLQLSQVCVRCG